MPEKLALEKHEVIAFARAVAMVPQQKRNRLVSFVNADLAFGEAGARFTLESVGLSDPVETFDDYGDTPASEAIAKYRRYGFFNTFEDDRPCGTQEAAEALVDHKNPTTQAVGAGAERRKDETILKGILGRMAFQVEDGPNKGEIDYIDLPSSQKVAINFNNLTKGAADGDAPPSSAVEGLTVPKLRKTNIILDEGEFESDSLPHIAVTEGDLQFLKTSVEMSAERHLVNNIGALMNGETEEFMGFRFVKVKPKRFAKAGLQLSGGANGWRIPVWYPEAIHYKERPLNTTRIWAREEKKFTWWIWYRNQDSCVREFDQAVVEIAVKRDF